MAKAAKLCNPTPFDANLNYEKGVYLKVPAFGSMDLTLNQMDDYRPDKPGSETALEEPEYFGLFLLDTDRPYENQALDAIRKSHDKKKTRYREVTKGHRERAARQNLTITDEHFKEIESQMGMDTLLDQVGTLAKLITKYEEIVQGTKESRKRKQLDPTRTVFALNPPKEFDSMVTRQFYLDENPEVALKEQEIRTQMEQAE